MWTEFWIENICKCFNMNYGTYTDILTYLSNEAILITHSSGSRSPSANIWPETPAIISCWISTKTAIYTLYNDRCMASGLFTTLGTVHLILITFISYPPTKFYVKHCKLPISSRQCRNACQSINQSIIKHLPMPSLHKARPAWQYKSQQNIGNKSN